MKKIKKLSVVIVALAICLLFTGTVWAQGTGTNVFGPSLDKTALHVSDQAQTVTLTIKAPQNVNLLGAKGTVYISDNTLECSINCFNETEGEYGENDNSFVWYDAEAEGVAVTTLVTVEVTIPAGYVGPVLIGLSELQYVASLDAANGTVDEVVASNLIETLVVSDHSHKYYGKDDTNHWSVCACGETIGEPAEHSYTLEGGTKCVCGAEKPVTPPPATGLKGDVDLDGAAGTLEDVTMLARHYMTYETIIDSQSLANGDIDGNGTIELEDLTALARFYMGYDTTLG